VCVTCVGLWVGGIFGVNRAPVGETFLKDPDWGLLALAILRLFLPAKGAVGLSIYLCEAFGGPVGGKEGRGGRLAWSGGIFWKSRRRVEGVFLAPCLGVRCASDKGPSENFPARGTSQRSLPPSLHSPTKEMHIFPSCAFMFPVAAGAGESRGGNPVLRASCKSARGQRRGAREPGFRIQGCRTTRPGHHQLPEGVAATPRLPGSLRQLRAQPVLRLRVEGP
jgi:hypothetical protein